MTAADVMGMVDEYGKAANENKGSAVMATRIRIQDAIESLVGEMTALKVAVLENWKRIDIPDYFVSAAAKHGCNFCDELALRLSEFQHADDCIVKRYETEKK